MRPYDDHNRLVAAGRDRLRARRYDPCTHCGSRKHVPSDCHTLDDMPRPLERPSANGPYLGPLPVRTFPPGASGPETMRFRITPGTRLQRVASGIQIVVESVSDTFATVRYLVGGQSGKRVRLHLETLTPRNYRKLG